MVHDWIMPKLEHLHEKRHILVRDPLRLLAGKDRELDAFGKLHNYAVIVARTNLAFRQKYTWAQADSSVRKILVVDQSSKQSATSPMHAPAPFYPDFLAQVPNDARLMLDLREYLHFKTGDSAWPQAVNTRHYAKLIVANLEAVLRAHSNLRVADPTRFTDRDLNQIVAYAALGIAESAFRTPTPNDYLRIGLFGLETLGELETLVPEVTLPIREELRNAPAPFRWFGTHDADTVVQTFYLSVLLAQHSSNWKLLVANIDRSLPPVAEIEESQVRDGAQTLVDMDREHAEHDMAQVEARLTKEALELFLVNEVKVATAEGYLGVLQRERFSTLLRSLALLLALDDRLSPTPNLSLHDDVELLLIQGPGGFVETREDRVWDTLKEIYLLAGQIRPLLDAATGFLRGQRNGGSFLEFWNLWNGQKVNRLDYYLSRLERLTANGELLPRQSDRLPSLFTAARERILACVQAWQQEGEQLLNGLNRRFQDLVAGDYPRWVAEDSEVLLTAQFVRRCLKPNWDPQTEKAALLIFDGMRYDIWDEMLRPLVEERMDILHDYPASSLLPSETQLTRKAISAGDFPDTFSRNASEGDLIQQALASQLGYSVPLNNVAPEGAGTGETVRYRAGNLDVYIFELCDKELHHILWKTLADGREVPARPLAFVYEQQIKNILDTEVQSILRRLEPGTKVFITADHGFGRVAREPIWFRNTDLNEPTDVKYLNAMLQVDLHEIDLPIAIQRNLIGFTPEQLRLPAYETINMRDGTTYEKEYRSVVFPRVGYSFKRDRSPFNPDAYSHGGASLPELMIPMIVLQVRGREDGLVALGQLEGTTELREGEEAVFRVSLRRIAQSIGGSSGGIADIKVDINAICFHGDKEILLPSKVVFLPTRGGETTQEIRFRPDTREATQEERRKGTMTLNLSLTVRWREGRSAMIQSRSTEIALSLTPEQVSRRMGNLDGILGMSPRSRG